MKTFCIGILTMSDAREHLHKTHYELNMRYQQRLCEALESTRIVKVVCGTKPIHSNEEAKTEAKRLSDSGVEMTIFNYAIWCYPQFTAVAANFVPGPYLLFSNLHPSECGMVGMMAASGALNQIGKVHFRCWGDANDSKVVEKLLQVIRAGCAVNRLKGLTYGSFGGRPMGMYTTVANRADWQRIFGIDVEDFEQYDIKQYGDRVPQEKVTHARKWLEQHARQVAYNGTNLTPEKLELQIRSYYGLRDMLCEHHIDFLGIKAHGDLTEWYCTMDIAEAFLNDSGDWDGPHEPIVAATECDMDGALSMQILKEISRTPVLFCDVRHYEASIDTWFFGNSGTSSTYYAARSNDPVQNMAKVDLLPQSKDYPAGGASVHYYAAPGRVTMARLARKGNDYILTIVPANIVNFAPEEMKRLGDTATPQWPMAFTKLDVNAELFLEKYPCNHIHGVYGDYEKELLYVAMTLGIKAEVLK
ncbi:MAG: L-fucose/L-arabinose isomerase family protein [Candidatus Excrementavichristensenella sp.]